MDVNSAINQQMSFTGDPADWMGDPMNAETGAWGVMKDFIKEYKNIKKSAMADNEAVSSLVEYLSNDILRIAGAMEDAVDKVTSTEANYDPNADLSALDSLTASTLTHADSKGICNTGGGSDTGIHCP